MAESHTLDNLDSPWDDDSLDTLVNSEADWNKLSNAFSTAGYREGLSQGKESDALQQGFNDGFANVGAPIGLELGFLRGATSAISSFLASANGAHQADIKDILSVLASLQFTDIAPRDTEAEDHARLHLEEMENEKWVETEEHARRHLEAQDEIVAEKRVKESLEEILAKLSSDKSVKMLTGENKASKEQLRASKQRLANIVDELGLDVNWS